MQKQAWLWLRAVLLRGRLEREMKAEMAEHIERSTTRLQARGLSRREARHEALREFGNVAYLQEEGRIARGTGWFHSLLGDLRFAIRHFARNPLSTVTMILVLSLGIGINVVIFTIVQGYTAQPPAGIEPSAELVRIRGSQNGNSGRVERGFTLDELEAYAELNRHFTAVGGWTSQPVTVAGGGDDEFTVTATFVTPGYFPVLGVQPILGRGLRADATDAQSIVLSHALWSRLYAEDSEVIGRTILLDQVPFTVVGIAPSDFNGAAGVPGGLQVWVPQASHRHVVPGGADVDATAQFRAIGRLAPGVGREEAAAAAQVVAAQVARSDSIAVDRRPGSEVVPLLSNNEDPGFDTQVGIIRGVFATLGLLILLVTCLNTSALQTGLALTRRREIAIRTSLGATRMRVIRQLVTESLLLAATAGLGGIFVSYVLFNLLRVVDGDLPFNLDLDSSVLLFTFGLAIGAGILFGVSPALHASRDALGAALKETATSVAGGRARLQRVLVVAQIAFTQPLAVCVTVFVLMAFDQVLGTPRNPYAERIVSLRLATDASIDVDSDFASSSTEGERIESERLVQALRQMPGVEAVVYSPTSVLFNQTAFSLDGSVGNERAIDEPFYMVGQMGMPGYLDLMGIPLLLGRDLQPADTASYQSGAIPAVIGDDMARTLWRGSNPIGQRIEQLSPPGEPLILEVVGVFEDPVEATGSLRQNFRAFVPVRTLPSNRFFLLRTSENAEEMIPAIRGVVRSVAPRSAIIEMSTFASMVDEERLSLWRATALISAGGTIALLLSALGLYAVVSFAVRKRTTEIAVRMAIGARPHQIVRYFAGDGLRLSALGILIGLPISILGLRAIFSASPEMPDMSLPLVTALVGVGVVLVAGIATWLPASRAARVDPAVALRRE